MMRKTKLVLAMVTCGLIFGSAVVEIGVGDGGVQVGGGNGHGGVTLSCDVKADPLRCALRLPDGGDMWG
ncbi:hypothetical protein ACFFMN_14340 [Planobispora siamensis]|uniref:Secreted protein n=1 Tax=Planobispora siamensis TaxID=936338 RepID=A0A8J3SBA3_9ACTN|nr:hypothetical protein [Planobispora siamensis]GIH89455.1 hypothetical protein Psi01_00850 [Planobispora siamensis]